MTKTSLMRVGLAAAVLAALPVAGRADTNGDIDAIYARLTEGIRTADPELSHKVYAEDAAYLGGFPSAIDRGAIVHQRMRESATRLKADGASMTIQFKVASRQLVGDSLAIDTGYYKTDMTRPTGEPRTMTRYNKFLVVAAKQKDGTWKITHDASGPATKEAWEGAMGLGADQ